MLHSQLIPTAIYTFTTTRALAGRPEPRRKAACLPAEKFLDLDFQHHDLGPVTGFNTPKPPTSRHNDLQKLFTKGNGPRPTLVNTEGANPADFQRDTVEAIRRRRRSSSSDSRGRQRKYNVRGGRVAVVMPTGHSPQRLELLQRKDGPRGAAG